MSFFLTGPIAVSLLVYNERLTVVLGLFTLILALAVFLSCRSGLTLLNKIGLKKLANSKCYQTFFKYHTYYWWVFWLMFVIHLLAAIMHLGFKNSGDPDAYLHIYSVIFGVAAVIALVVVSFSCRGIAGILRLFSERKVNDFRSLGRLFRFHAYYWLLFFLVIATHFTISFIHNGLWPSAV
jgi:cytochrome b561